MIKNRTTTIIVALMLLFTLAMPATAHSTHSITCSAHEHSIVTDYYSGGALWGHHGYHVQWSNSFSNRHSHYVYEQGRWRYQHYTSKWCFGQWGAY